MHHNKVEDEESVQRDTDDYLGKEYSIHFHVWTEAEILEVLMVLQRKLGMPFGIELIYRMGYEVMVVLRKVTSVVGKPEGERSAKV